MNKLIKNQTTQIRLLSNEAITYHSKRYNFRHIGLVQITIKPLFRHGLGISIPSLLRHKRHLNFQNSLLTYLKSNLEGGPVFSNCYPKFTIDLIDGAILNALTLQMETKNLNLYDWSK